MVDREARDKLATALRAYMDEEITAFEFDEAVTETHDSGDETVGQLGFTLWLFYDDVKDHKVVATKEAWDFFNRVLLLLESDAELDVIKGARQWRLRQALATVCLAVFCLLAYRMGIGGHLLLVAIPFGMVSMAISWRASREDKQASPNESIDVFPFPSFADLLAVRRKVATFKKRPFSAAVAKRRIRHWFWELPADLPGKMILGACWLILSPFVLFFQMFPRREPETIVMRHGT